MSNDATIALITIVFSFSASIIGSFLVFRVSNKRATSQNAKDDLETAQIALQISENSTKKQLELETEIHKLQKILNNTHYRVTVTFKLGENPIVESATIESIQIPRSRLRN